MSKHKKICNCDLTGIPPVEVKPEDSRQAFMDGTDFLFELGNDHLSHLVYGDPDELKSDTLHTVDHCGIAEVKITFVRWIKKPL